MFNSGKLHMKSLLRDIVNKNFIYVFILPAFSTLGNWIRDVLEKLIELIPRIFIHPPYFISATLQNILSHSTI